MVWTYSKGSYHNISLYYDFAYIFKILHFNYRTPVLDIKPYVPAFDSFENAKAGWMDKITTDMKLVRTSGYQSIYSARGARSTRAGNRKRRLLQNSSNLNETQSVTES